MAEGGEGKMAFISRVSITKLNGYMDIVIPLRDKHCILVGPNGSGKSTALQIIAYALGRQWVSLGNSRFEKLVIDFDNGRNCFLTREACLSYRRSGVGNTRIIQLREQLVKSDLYDSFISADLSNRDIATEFEIFLGTRPGDLRATQQFIRRQKNTKSNQKELSDFMSELNNNQIPGVVYLPTYRRIELELDRMLTEVPDYRRLEVRTQIKTGVSTEYLVELVKFGMEDVANSVQLFERQTRDFARNRFNRMMTSYLKEMANSQVLSVGDLRSRHIDANTIEIVLSRIEEGLLSPEEKQQISKIILDLSSGPGAGNQPFNKKWLAHFFVRLMEVNKDIEEREGPIRLLVASLDKYFFPKAVNYDIESYHFSINGENGEELPLSDLSSGEKQIVSILAQLHLNKKPVNIMIDEPELSLSVPWQSDLLPDISQTSTCNQIFAVTHSPFIYENSFLDSVVDFLEARK